MYIYIYIYIYIFVNLYIYIHIYIHMYLRIHIYTYMHLYIYIFVFIYVFSERVKAVWATFPRRNPTRLLRGLPHLLSEWGSRGVLYTLIMARCTKSF